jgi:uncharacterized membrane protein YphA (DoxX/SURF4 family)
MLVSEDEMERVLGRVSRQLYALMVPIRNGGELAVLYCFVFLYIASRGAVVWGVDPGSRR